MLSQMGNQPRPSAGGSAGLWQSLTRSANHLPPNNDSTWLFLGRPNCGVAGVIAALAGANAEDADGGVSKVPSPAGLQLLGSDDGVRGSVRYATFSDRPDSGNPRNIHVWSFAGNYLSPCEVAQTLSSAAESQTSSVVNGRTSSAAANDSLSGSACLVVLDGSRPWSLVAQLQRYGRRLAAVRRELSSKSGDTTNVFSRVTVVITRAHWATIAATAAGGAGKSLQRGSSGSSNSGPNDAMDEADADDDEEEEEDDVPLPPPHTAPPLAPLTVRLLMAALMWEAGSDGIGAGALAFLPGEAGPSGYLLQQQLRSHLMDSSENASSSGCMLILPLQAMQALGLAASDSGAGSIYTSLLSSGLMRPLPPLPPSKVATIMAKSSAPASAAGEGSGGADDPSLTASDAPSSPSLSQVCPALKAFFGRLQQQYASLYGLPTADVSDSSSSSSSSVDTEGHGDLSWDGLQAVVEDSDRAVVLLPPPPLQLFQSKKHWNKTAAADVRGGPGQEADSDDDCEEVAMTSYAGSEGTALASGWMARGPLADAVVSGRYHRLLRAALKARHKCFKAVAEAVAATGAGTRGTHPAFAAYTSAVTSFTAYRDRLTSAWREAEEEEAEAAVGALAQASGIKMRFAARSGSHTAVTKQGHPALSHTPSLPSFLLSLEATQRLEAVTSAAGASHTGSRSGGGGGGSSSIGDGSTVTGSGGIAEGEDYATVSTTSGDVGGGMRGRSLAAAAASNGASGVRASVICSSGNNSVMDTNDRLQPPRPSTVSVASGTTTAVIASIPVAAPPATIAAPTAPAAAAASSKPLSGLALLRKKLGGGAGGSAAASGGGSGVTGGEGGVGASSPRVSTVPSQGAAAAGGGYTQQQHLLVLGSSTATAHAAREPLASSTATSEASDSSTAPLLPRLSSSSGAASGMPPRQPTAATGVSAVAAAPRLSVPIEPDGSAATAAPLPPPPSSSSAAASSASARRTSTGHSSSNNRRLSQGGSAMVGPGRPSLGASTAAGSAAGAPLPAPRSRGGSLTSVSSMGSASLKSLQEGEGAGKELVDRLLRRHEGE